MNSLSPEFIVAIFTMFLSIGVTTVLFLITRMQKEHRYDQKESRAIIDKMRDSFEKQIYMLTERLMATEDRWRDVNHLLLSSQAKQDISQKKAREVILTDFLKSAGISESDLQIDKKLVFVLIPFNERFNTVFKAIQEICQNVGLKCLRGDEEFIKGDILRHILSGIIKSNIVIANIEGRNPNVFYELGIAHAMDKGTILIAESVGDLPVDIKSKRIVLYKDIKELQYLLKDELLKILISD